MDIPSISVGIMKGKEISFTLIGDFLCGDSPAVVSGVCKAGISDRGIFIESASQLFNCPDRLNLVPVEMQTAKFILDQVSIGIDFHWERKEDQVFKGELLFVKDRDQLYAINKVTIEDYLISVISSEMSATSSLEFLKAHAVISRSWLLAQVRKTSKLQKEHQNYQTTFRAENELIRWYDREDHHHFDVCADDHCQRYQGITRATTPLTEQAVLETCGEVLTFEGVICDARFSKCCGGVSEVFENVWEPVNHPYLQKVVDNSSQSENRCIDLTKEDAVNQWIIDRPDVFCNTSDKRVLTQVLNDYDQETNDFFRWKVIYSQNELSDLVRAKTGIDFGRIVNLIPVERGVSGRLIRLKIVGTLRTMIIGKELEIRKTLSKTHLYSSAFIIDRQEVSGEINFILHGAGWGHGVGLCQIGAAVMGSMSYKYPEILAHYFRGAELMKMY